MRLSLPNATLHRCEVVRMNCGANFVIAASARSNPNAPGSRAIQYWLTHGDNTPFGFVRKPGTEAKPW